MAELMIHANTEVGHWRNVVQALKLFVGSNQVCVLEHWWLNLNLDKDVVNVHTGLFDYYKPGDRSTKANTKLRDKKWPQRITFWWKEQEKEFAFLLNDNNFQPENIDFVHVCNGNGDSHGMGKF